MCIPKTESKRKLQVLTPRPKASALWLWQGRTLASGLTLTHVLGPFLTPLCPGLAGRGVVGKETQNLASNALPATAGSCRGTERPVGTGWGRRMRVLTPRSSSLYLSQDQGLKTLRQAGVLCGEAAVCRVEATDKPGLERFAVDAEIWPGPWLRGGCGLRNSSLSPPLLAKRAGNKASVLVPTPSSNALPVT